MNRSVFSKFFVTFLAVTLISFSFLGVTLYGFLGEYALEEKQNKLVGAGEKLSDMTIMLLESEMKGYGQLYDSALDMMSKNLDATILLGDAKGDVKALSKDSRLSGKWISVPDSILNTVNKNQISKTVGNFGGVFAESVLIVGMPIYYKERVLGGIYLIADAPEIAQIRQDVLHIYLLYVLIAFAVSFIIVYYLSRRITSPLRTISNATKKMASGDFSQRVHLETEDEIRQLADTFNEMADSLEKLEDMRKNFISDVSHELRTPMTTITGFVQGILDDTIPPEKQKFYLKIVLDESKRLAKLVDDLLDISRLSSEQKPLELSSFDINEMLRLAVIGFDGRFNEKKLEVKAFFEQESAMVFAEKDSIQRVVNNLMDNAIKFSYENGTIELRTGTQGDKVLVSIRNTGIGISEENRKSIFERFFMQDKSRSKNQSGVGLGLYLVKSILQKHREMITVDSVEKEYAEFTFTLKKANI